MPQEALRLPQKSGVATRQVWGFQSTEMQANGHHAVHSVLRSLRRTEADLAGNFQVVK